MGKQKKQMQKFLVLKDADGTFRPLVFITPVGAAGDIRAIEYKEKKLEEGETIVEVEMKEV